MWSKPTKEACGCSHGQVDQPQMGKQKILGHRYGQVIRLKPECVDEYKKLHATVVSAPLPLQRDGWSTITG